MAGIKINFENVKTAMSADLFVESRKIQRALRSLREELIQVKYRIRDLETLQASIADELDRRGE
mgnify:CR=1 FL=1